MKTKYFLAITMVSFFSFLLPLYAVTNVKKNTSATTSKKNISKENKTKKVPINQKFDVAVWIPYWKKSDGVASTLLNIDKITQISPFSFDLQNDGTIKNSLKYDSEPWTELVEKAKKKNIKVYPSILSYPLDLESKQKFYEFISDDEKRNFHIKEIVKLVNNNNFDGIDIDYEAKLAETKPYFSKFLTDLNKELKKTNKDLICTVEPRTPPESRYATTSKIILSKVEYANDYKVIGSVCDQVRIMAYDQYDDDKNLSIRNNEILYTPVADILWVQKVLTLALTDIPANKIILGIPTYGNKYEITPASFSKKATYKKIGSMNYNYASELAKDLTIKPFRNIAGEVSFVYSTSTDIYGKSYGEEKLFLVWYSDATSTAEKVKLAKLYNLGGVAIFKVDGGQDPDTFKFK